ncbi:MAG: hypothetical protein LBK95_08355 [Bifidobacteriaceae bacterium]|jgi:nitroreductase|nr:hypothetical protein [Bifidobacteriaceae bacterium]
MDLYPAILTRHSVHQFGADPLDPAILEEILEAVRSARGIGGQSIEAELATGSQVKGSSAPHHLLAFTAQDDVGFANAGYVLQEADLALQTQGLGSHWIGLAKPKAKRPDFTIALAFGPTDEPPRQPEAFNRLDLSAISDQDNCVARAVRLAPSGINDQPWRLEFDEGLVRLIHTRRGPFSLVLAKKVDKISLGIATRHAVVALAHEGHEVSSVVAADHSGSFCLEVSYH